MQGSVRPSERLRRPRGPLIALATLVIVCVACVAVVPRMIASFVEQQLRRPGADTGARSEVERVSLAWPGRLRVEGFRLRLAQDAEPSIAVESADVRFAPLSWLLGRDFLQVTLTSPRLVLRRRPEGTFDLVEYLWRDGSAEPEHQEEPNARVLQTESDDSTEAELEPEPEFTPEERDADAAASDAGEAAATAWDGSLWIRSDDPFAMIGGTLRIENGSLSIIDAASGQRAELMDAALTFHAQKLDETLSLSLSARQRGREGREGAVSVQGRLARTSAGRFWLQYDGSEYLRAADLEVRAQVAPCVVGDLDVGGELDVAVHSGRATVNGEGTLNGGTVAFRLAAETRARGLSPVGDVHLEMRDVGLVPAFAPLLARVNPIFDVGSGTLGGRLDTTWDGGWPETSAARQHVRLRGSLAVRDLTLSEAPLVTAILRALGEPGRQLSGDLVAADIRWDGGRVSYDRMALAGRDRQLAFAGTIAENGALRLSCELGTSRRVPIVGWVHDPRLSDAVQARRRSR